MVEQRDAAPAIWGKRTGLPQWMSKRGTCAVSLSSSLPRGLAEAESIKILKGLQVRFSDSWRVRSQLMGHNFWLKRWWMDRDVKWKKYVTASCTLSVSSYCQLLSEAGIRVQGILYHVQAGFMPLYKCSNNIHEKAWITQCLTPIVKEISQVPQVSCPSGFLNWSPEELFS